MDLYKTLPIETQDLVSKYCDKDDLKYIELIEYASEHGLPIYKYKELRRICFEHKKRLFIEHYSDDICNIGKFGHEYSSYDCKTLYSRYIKDNHSKFRMSSDEYDKDRSLYMRFFIGCNTFNYKKSSCECGLLDNLFRVVSIDGNYNDIDSIKKYNVKDSLIIKGSYYDYYNIYRSKAIEVRL